MPSRSAGECRGFFASLLLLESNANCQICFGLQNFRKTMRHTIDTNEEIIAGSSTPK